MGGNGCIQWERKGRTNFRERETADTFTGDLRETGKECESYVSERKERRDKRFRFRGENADGERLEYEDRRTTRGVREV